MAVALAANSKLRVGHRVLPLPLPAPAAAGTQLWRRQAAWTPVFLGPVEKSPSSVSAYSGRKMGRKEVAAVCFIRATAPPGGAKDDTEEEDSPLVGVPAAFSDGEASQSPSGWSASTTTSFSSSAPSTGPTSTPGKGNNNNQQILWSDVEVRRRRKVYWGRRWSALDVGTAGVVVSMHALCLFAPWAFTWGALWTAAGLYLATGLLGITLSFHRNLSHRSFRLPKWLEYTFAYCGVQALQGNPLDWVSTHRYHHQHCDSDRDPHSPLEGFWFSHMSWLFDTAAVVQRCGEPSNVGDLEKQPFYRFLRRTYVVHPIALAAVLYAAGGFPYLVWGMGVRVVWVYHVTWLVNSACHVWGRQPWNTGDLSRNNWWVAALAFGEGWHNNHHAFEYSARHGLEWWQLDATWYVVRLRQWLGLATDMRLPSRAHLLEKKKTAAATTAAAATMAAAVAAGSSSSSVIGL